MLTQGVSFIAVLSIATVKRMSRQIQLFLRDKAPGFGAEIKETVCHYTVLTANYISRFPYIWLRELQPLEGEPRLVRMQQFTSERLN